jgi:hypothetical protein
MMKRREKNHQRTTTKKKEGSSSNNKREIINQNNSMKDSNSPTPRLNGVGPACKGRTKFAYIGLGYPAFGTPLSFDIATKIV